MPHGLREALVARSAYGDVAEYDGERFCACDRLCAGTADSTSEEEQLQALVDEVSENGYADVLIMRDGGQLQEKARQRTLDPRNTGRMNSAEVLAVLLYTGTRLQHSLRMSMLGQEAVHLLWPRLAKALQRAICKQSGRDGLAVPMKLYHGLHNVTLNDMLRFIDPETFAVSFTFNTFVSASQDRDIAMGFAAGEHGTYDGPLQDQGLLLELSCSAGHPACADVSWLSMYPNEKEVLIAPWQLLQPKEGFGGSGSLGGGGSFLGGAVAARSVSSVQDAERAIERATRQEQSGNCTVDVWNIEVRPAVCVMVGGVLSRRLSDEAAAAVSPQQTVQQHLPVYYLSEQQHTVIARHPSLRELVLPLWVPFRDISRALHGEAGVRTIEACEERWGAHFCFATEFANAHATWLFAEPTITIDDETFPSAEHYFQIKKSHGMPDHEMAKIDLMSQEDPLDVAACSRRYSMRPDWNATSPSGYLTKFDVMWQAVSAKFSQDQFLRELLLATADRTLLHVTTDAYWGTGLDARGENMLGLVLERVRAHLRAQ